MDTKRLQEIEYYTSLREDILKDIRSERNIKRNKIQELLQIKVPTVIENGLTPDENRLLRVYKIRPNVLSEAEVYKARQIIERMNRIQTGGCYNITRKEEETLTEKEYLMSIVIPNVTYKICFSILETFQKGGFNEDLKMASAFIHLDNEVYEYPLNQDEYELLIGKALMSGIDFENRNLYAPRRYSDLDVVIGNLSSVKI